MAYAKFADEVLILSSDGQMTQQGPPEAISWSDDLTNSEKAVASSTDDTAKVLTSQRSAVSATSAKEDEDQNLKQDSEFGLFKYYFQAMGFAFVPPFLLLQAAYAFSFKFPDVWLKWWSESEQANPGERTRMYMIGYVCLALSAITSMIGFLWVFLVVAVPRASSKLHQVLVATTMAAPLFFLTTTDSGTLLNRFSQDMSLIDMQLPFAFLMTLDGTVQSIAEGLLIALGSSWTPFLIPPTILVLYFLQRHYLRTSRQLRFLTIESKAPLYNNFTETLHGLVTLRAFRWQSKWLKRNERFLDRSQVAIYATFCLQRWLNLVLDLLVAACAVTVIVVATGLSDASSDGSLGVALVNVLSFSTTLTYFIQAWTELETSIGAVARIESFAEETPNENLLPETDEPPARWPSDGIIKFDDLTASYRSEIHPST